LNSIFNIVVAHVQSPNIDVWFGFGIEVLPWTVLYKLVSPRRDIVTVEGKPNKLWNAGTESRARLRMNTNWNIFIAFIVPPKVGRIIFSDW